MEHYISVDQVNFAINVGCIALAFVSWVFVMLAARKQKWPIWKYPVLVFIALLIYGILKGIIQLYFMRGG